MCDRDDEYGDVSFNEVLAVWVATQLECLCNNLLKTSVF